MRLRLRDAVPALLLAAAAGLPSAVVAWSCDAVETKAGTIDLSGLAGTKDANKETDTPPTKNEARVRFNVCGTLDKEDGVSDEDQCPENTRVCLKLVNHKESSKEPERVTTVIPMWTTDTPDKDVTMRGGKGEYTLKVASEKYAGALQTFELELECGDDNVAPFLDSYTEGTLKVKWVTPGVCESAITPGGGGSAGGGSGSSGGGGFFGFLKFCFWLAFFGLLAYFVIGALYNHQQYSARGWDLVPHRDFWRELPALAGDFGGHVFSNVRSSTGRGGYSSLG